MKLKKAWFVSSLALLTTFSAVTADQGSDRIINQKLLQLLKTLNPAASEAYVEQPASQAISSVTGRFNFIITIERISNNTEPMECAGTVNHFTSGGLFYYESANGKVIWNGDTGTCKISILYTWKNADSLAKVSISTGLSPYYPCESTCVERPISRVSRHDLRDIPLPANGEVTKITDSFTL